MLVRDEARIDPKYLFCVSKELAEIVERSAEGIGVRGVTRKFLSSLQIPLPPLSVQKEIVAEIEGYQKVIDGARAVIDNYRPHIPVNPDWPLNPIAEVCTVNPRKSEISNLSEETEVSFVPMADLGEHEMFFKPKKTKKLADVGSSYTYFRDGDVLVAKVTPCFENGKAGIARYLKNETGFGSSELYVLRPSEKLLSEWIFLNVANSGFRSWASPQMTGTGGLQRVPKSVIQNYEIPVPSLREQQEIVAEIEAEQKLVEANRELIEGMEAKIKQTIARVWGESD